MAILFLTGTMTLPSSKEETSAEFSDIFEGFSTDIDIWNETPFSDVASPGTFDFTNTIGYDDVAVLINNQSEASRTIGWAFVSARNISADRVFIFDNTSTPTGETINRNQFDTYFLEPFRAMLSNRSSSFDINYLVTTKGIPLRVSGGNDKASFDQEISLVGGYYDSSIGSDYWVTHGYGPLAGKEMEQFTRDKYGFFLVTRLTGYTVDTALELIEKANNSFGARGIHVLDLATNRNGSGYKYWNDDLYITNTTLNETMNLSTFFDEETEFVTNISNVIGYASWGSNDGNWNKNRMANSGFDTSDNSWMSGSKYWNYSNPVISANESFSWARNTAIDRNGGSSLGGELDAGRCTTSSRDSVNGLLFEYFDNAGVTYNSSLMPNLTGRIPDFVRIESTPDISATNSAWAGLDDRFKDYWSLRLTAMINIPEAGNWTFYVESDDGSKLWINNQSVVNNQGIHGMSEQSGSIYLTNDSHELRLEFFEHGGHAGLRLKWSGPNITKQIIPDSALTLIPYQEVKPTELIHHWTFSEGSGSITNDSIGNADLTIEGASWVDCPTGKCLEFDGIDDWAHVDVDDWAQNFSISQWVWTENISQATNSATFAINDVAGDNNSFQLIAHSSGKWSIYSNQTHHFGDQNFGEWQHLAVVFDNGTLYQYLDGVEVSNRTYQVGDLNNFDLYKMGVNRAGNTYFEGRIDEVRIWNSSLNQSEVRQVFLEQHSECPAFSGAGSKTTSVWQEYDIIDDHIEHAWVLYAYGLKDGDVNGAWRMKIEGLDNNGNVLSNNESNWKNFGTTWEIEDFRFRPHENASKLNISLVVRIDAMSTEGSYHFDTVTLRNIRPNMGWIDGSIAETAVSTGGRSFNVGTSYGQSLVADLLEDGVSGVKGYVYEPYLTAVSYPSVLLPSYASGYTMAESYAASNLLTGWMGVVVGDPKMSAYGNIVHDVEIIDARIQENVSLNQNFTIQIALQNLGAGEADGWLTIKNKLGGTVLSNQSMIIPSGNQSGSRLIINTTINTGKAGWNNIVIRWEAANMSKPERIIDNNNLEVITWANSPPEIEDIYCDNSHYSRGDRFVCSIEAIDDSGVTNASLAWRVTGNNNSSTPWVWSATGSQDGLLWWTTIDLPSDVSLGSLDLMAIVWDESNQSIQMEKFNVALIENALALWYGIFVTGIDNPDWGGANALPSNPSGGVTRGLITLLRACVLDADHAPSIEAPIFVASRGSIGTMSYQSGSSSNHHCYIANYALPVATSLDYFTLELRDHNQNFITKRNIGISDITPEIEMAIVDEEFAVVNNLLAGGNEYLLISVTDADDTVEGVYGDLNLTWPGQAMQTIPINFENGIATVQLLPLQSIESGEVIFEVNIIGANGASNSSEWQVPIQLSPPEIIDIDLCRNGIEIDELMFGDTADAVVHVHSSRDLSIATATIQQHGWSVIAPQQSSAQCGEEYEDETHTLHFRIQLDSSFVAGDGSLAIHIIDLDELTSNSIIHFDFIHSPPQINVTASNNISAGENLEFLVEMNDADGINSVCGLIIKQMDTEILNRSATDVSSIDDTGIWSAGWLIPDNFEGNITAMISCMDISNNEVNWSGNITVTPLPECTDCNDSEQNTIDPTSTRTSSIVMLTTMIAMLILILSFIFIRMRKNDTAEDENTDWVVEDSEPERDERIPEGWSLEEFIEWINGPVPEDWNENQWNEYRDQMEDLL